MQSPNDRYTFILPDGKLFAAFVEYRFNFESDEYGYFPEVVQYVGTGVRSWHGNAFVPDLTFPDAMVQALNFVLKNSGMAYNDVPSYSEQGIRLLTPTGRLFSMFPVKTSFAPNGDPYSVILTEGLATGYSSLSQSLRRSLYGATVPMVYQEALRTILDLLNEEN